MSIGTLLFFSVQVWNLEKYPNFFFRDVLLATGLRRRTLSSRQDASSRGKNIYNCLQPKSMLNKTLTIYKLNKSQQNYD